MPGDAEALKTRLRMLFVEELDDNLLVLNRALLALEQGDTSNDPVGELFRAAHSLKGAAQSAGVEPAEAVCHRLEDALGRLRDGTLAPDGPTLAQLFAAVDVLAEIGRRLQGGSDVAGLPVADTVAGLARLASDAPAPRAAAVAAADEGVARRDDGGAVDALSVRVSHARLESLLNQAGELLVASTAFQTLAADLTAAVEIAAAHRSEVATLRTALVGTRGTHGHDALLAQELTRVERGALGVAERLEVLARAARAADRTLGHTGEALVEGVRAASMLPFEQVCVGLDRVVRDLAAADGKQVKLELAGVDVELDRPIVAALREPVLHLLRNAVSHGVESPQERRRAGKPTNGTITIAAALRSDVVEVTVADDGAGIDLAALRAGAERRAVPVPEDDPLGLVFAPGLTTAPLLTEVSGRGVGMDAVRVRTEALGGSVQVTSQRGVGTSVTLRLPLTLSTLRVVFVVAATEIYALPTTAVGRLVRAPVSALRSVDTLQTLLVDGRPVRVLSLARAVGAAEAEELRPGGIAAGVLVRVGDLEAVLLVGELLDEREVVMKPLGPRLAALPWALGATVLPDGRAAFVLNAAALLRSDLGHRIALGGMSDQAQRTTPARILLVEDTFTTRALERSILEAAGYDVVIAVDGLEAWELLQRNDVDLVITDVQMSRMDGFALCDAIRGSHRFADLPVMLVTSLGSEEDRRRGIEVGANAYIVKSSFEQPVLLETIARLL